MNTEPEIRLARHDATEARLLMDNLVCVYAEIYAHKADDPFFTVDRFTARLIAHSSRPGYELITAWDGGTLVGYAYGVPLSSDTHWWDGLEDPLPADMLRETGRRTFALNEIMVRAGWRRRGIAAMLHDELMSGRTEDRATLLVESANAPAHNAYTAWGWRRLGRLKPFPDSPLYDAMILELAARRSAAS
jgi:GNAT superfamily N-acetyltransferase